MRLMKIAIVIAAIVTAGVLYMNKEMVTSLITGEKKVQHENVFNTNTHFKIDPKIKDKEAYSLDARLQSMYNDLSSALIKQDKDIRKRLFFMQDMSTEDINKRILGLEALYEKERQKIRDYCAKGSSNCMVKVDLTGDKVIGSDVKMNMRYSLDDESIKFFNEVNYVTEEDEKWYDSVLISVNEKRHYPKMGKFQDRKHEVIMKEDTSKRVDLSHILEGNANQWNVRF